MFGIDIEPDSRTKVAKRVVVDNCEITENTGGGIVDQFRGGMDIEVINSKIENTAGLNGNTEGRRAIIENCDIILNDTGAMEDAVALNCRYYLQNCGKALFVNNCVLKNCTFSGKDEKTESNMRIYITGGGELTNCSFYNIKGENGANSGTLDNTWGILFAINNSGTKQATGELINNNNYYENCDIWCQVFKDSKGFGIDASEFNACHLYVYNMFLKDTQINNCTTYLIKYVKKYNCYIDNVYYNDQ